MKKKIRRIVLVVAIVVTMIFLMFVLTHAVNENYISDYHKAKYHTGYFNATGFTEGYIYPYNVGDSYYQMENYAMAETYFRKALAANPPEEDERDCKVRINLALSMVKQLDLTKVTKENVQEYLDVLYEARDILCENGCAHRNDNDGHSKDAQTLKNEIDELIKQLEQLQNEQESSEEESSEEESSENESQSNEEESTPPDEEETTSPEEESQSENESESEGESSGENETEEETTNEGESSGEGETESGEQETETTDEYSELESILQSLQDAANEERLPTMDGYGNYSGGTGKYW